MTAVPRASSLGEAIRRQSPLKIARDLLGATYRATRGVPDRVLRRRRHRAVRDRIARMTRPRSILVVCHGNICRSPYLHMVLQRLLPDISVSSAGFMGWDRRPPSTSVEVCAARGIDLSSFHSRRLSLETIRSSDLIIVMDAEQARYIASVFAFPSPRIVIAGDLDPIPSPSRAVRDPWGQSSEVFVATFDRLDRAAQTLAAVLPARQAV